MREDDWLQSVFTLQIKSLCTGLICSLCAKLFEFPTWHILLWRIFPFLMRQSRVLCHKVINSRKRLNIKNLLIFIFLSEIYDFKNPIQWNFFHCIMLSNFQLYCLIRREKYIIIDVIFSLFHYKHTFFICLFNNTSKPPYL